jgi:precorrin-8X/cobalt-precorrin-8 methylmutase
MATIKSIAPADIETRSFAIIEHEFLEQTGMSPAEIENRRFQVMRRVIHATGDFGFAQSLVFHENAIEAGLAAIRAGRNVYIDVSMGAAGISATLLAKFGGTVECCINDADVAERARSEGKTRSETALEKISDRDVGIVAVGNAPTALVAAMRMVEEGRLDPALIVGVPVGFVNAEESKQILALKSYPFITNSGRKGGTPVAVAIVNALIRLAS